MNPEFLRYCWTEFTLQRIALVMVALTLIFGTASLVDGPQLLSLVSLALMLIVAIGVGVPQVAKSISHEISQRTWDWKRMSPAKPFTLVIGKLLGAPIFSLCVLFILSAIYLLSSIVAEGALLGPLSRLVITLLFIALAYSIVLLSQLDQLNQIGMAGARMGGLNPVIPITVVAGFFVWKVLSFRGVTSTTVAWYGLQCNLLTFWIASLVVFLAWAIFGCYRLMRRELAYFGSPFGFLGFLLFVWVYAFGFFEGYAPQQFLAQPNVRMVAFFGLGCSLTLIATYFNLLTEPVSQSQILRLKQSLGSFNPWRSLKLFPRWLLAIVVLVIAMLPLGASALLASSEIAAHMAAFFVSASCFCFRDCAVYLLSKGRLRSHRRDFIFFGWLAIMYLLIPIFWAALSGSASPFTSPLFFPSWAIWGWIPPISQAAIAGGILWIGSRGKTRDPD